MILEPLYSQICDVVCVVLESEVARSILSVWDKPSTCAKQVEGFVKLEIQILREGIFQKNLQKKWIWILMNNIIWLSFSMVLF